MTHKSTAFYFGEASLLLSVRWALGKKASGDYLLIQEGVLTIPTKKRQKVKVFRKDFLVFLQKNDQHKCQPFTIPTFQALNVRFSAKIFAKIFEPAQKQDPTVRMNEHRKSTRPFLIGRHKIFCTPKNQSPPLPPISVTSPPSVTSWLNMTSRCGGCWLKKLL